MLGLWASGGDGPFNDQIAALKNTIDQYCDNLGPLVAGISVGSEDLYRISPIGQAASPDPGASPTTLAKYIQQVRDTIKGSCLEKAPIGHVDTWTVYVNATNKPLIDAVDWLGMDAYPYFEKTKPNGLENAVKLFQSALDQTKAAAGGKPVWITETGWPDSGDKSGDAVPSIENAQTYWQEVGCPMFGNTNVWWFTLQDGAPTTPNPSFGLVGSQLSTKPIYDLSCKGHTDPPVVSSSSSSKPAESSKTSVAPPSSTQEQKPSTTAVTSSGAEQSSAAQPTTSAAGKSSSESQAPPPVVTLTTTRAGQTHSQPMTTNNGGSGGATTSAPVEGGSSTTGGSPVPTNAGNRLTGYGAALAGVAVAAVAAL